MSPIITGVRFKMFTSNGTFVVPEGVTKIYVTGCGGGGGGAYYNSGSYNGGSGGTTSLGSLISFAGGGGGSVDATADTRGSSGGSGGSPGVYADIATTAMVINLPGAHGRIGHYGKGGDCWSNNATGLSIGSGGSGAFSLREEITVTPGSSHSVTIGSGGSSSYQAGNQGVLIVEW